jgi:hypothetical protein
VIQIAETQQKAKHARIGVKLNHAASKLPVLEPSPQGAPLLQE